MKLARAAEEGRRAILLCCSSSGILSLSAPVAEGLLPVNELCLQQQREAPAVCVSLYLYSLSLLKTDASSHLLAAQEPLSLR